MKDDQMKSYAGFWKRAGAFVLDYIIILGYLIALTLLFLFLNKTFNVDRFLFTTRVQSQFMGFLFVTLPVTLYFAFGESSRHQATWGKQRLKLKVTDYNGNKVGFWRAFARTLLKFIPWEISHTLVWAINFSPQTDSLLINYGFGLVYLLIGLNVASLILTKTHQTLYDFLAKTFVTAQGGGL
jgi:uncharacterized RDD family membrane protein YckC